MNHRFLCGLALGLAVLVSGCATRTKMAFASDDAQAQAADLGKPVFLMTANLKNSYRPSHQPRLLVVHVEKPGAKEAADRLNFTMDEKAKSSETDAPETGNTYLLRMPLEPGPYEIRGLTSMSRSFPIIGMFFAPLHASLEAKGPGVFYLGHMSATVRERQGNEFKAGGTLPLVDQAVAGASGGTFDVDISDRLDQDEALFRAQFPALKGVEIKKAILPPFDRAIAQKWWEAN